MNQEAKNDLECELCDETEDLNLALVAREPITPESAHEYQELAFCDEHFSTILDGDEYYVRELAPIPDDKGGFERTMDDKDKVILYDHDISEDSWIRFDAETEHDFYEDDQ